MYRNSFVHYLTRTLVEIMFYAGIVICLALPFVMPTVAQHFNNPDETVVPLTVVLLTSGICALYILWQLKLMFKTLIGGNPFIDANVTCLRKCAVAGFLIAIIYLIKAVFSFTPATAVIFVIFSLAALFCLTLKDVFKQAIAYKEENDWTV
jgi:hypothetical protein